MIFTFDCPHCGDGEVEIAIEVDDYGAGEHPVYGYSPQWYVLAGDDVCSQCYHIFDDEELDARFGDSIIAQICEPPEPHDPYDHL